MINLLVHTSEVKLILEIFYVEISFFTHFVGCTSKVSNRNFVGKSVKLHKIHIIVSIFIFEHVN